MHSNSKTLAMVSLISAALIWGVTGPVMKLTLQTVPIFCLAFIRFGTASILLFAVLRNKLFIKREHLKTLFLAGLFGVTFNISLFFLGLKFTTALNAGILVSSIPIFTLLAANIFLKEKIKNKFIAGAILGIIGIFVIVAKDVFGNGMSVFPLGDILIFASVLSFVGYETISKKLFKIYSPLVITFYAFFIGAVTFLPFAVLEFQKNSAWINNLSGSSIAGTAYGIFFSSLGAYSLWQWGLSKIEESRVGFFFYLDPIASTVAAVILLSETITWPFILGSIFIFLGLFIAEAKIPYFHFRHFKKIEPAASAV